MARSTYEDFVIKEKIGSGSYGVVFKVIRKVDRHTYAMKEIDLQGMSRKEQEECIRETRVLSSLDSDYIIKYYDSFLERGKLYIITEYAGNGNLHDYIKKQKTKLAEDLIWKLFIQILLGLNHMHEKKILHRDIKTLNVFLDDDLNVKLGDMGVAKILSTNTNFAKTIVGTPYYLSPELCEDKPYNEKSDVWALGVVLYECCTQRHPFDADNQGALILKILRGKYPAVNGYSADINDIIKRCLTQNANRRPNTYKVLTLPMVRQKAEEQGIAMPDQQVTALKAEKAAVPKMKSINGVASSADSGTALSTAPSNSSEEKPSLGATLQARLPAADRAGQVDVSVSGVSATNGDIAAGAAAAAAAVAAGEGGEPLEAAWRVAAKDAPPAPGAPRTGVAGWAQAAKQMEGLAVHGEEEDATDEEDNAHNIYRDAHVYRDGEDGEEAEADGEAGGEEGEGGEDEEGYEDDGGVYEDEPAWQPDPARIQNMQSAALLQRAACLDLIGEKAFNELYALLKSNQVDEASMTDLSRLVFKIIPYDKSEVIQMMYKLLYLESQLDGSQ